MYSSWNVYKTFCKNINTNQLALYILNHLSEEDRNKILEDIGNEQEIDSLPFKKELLNFKRSNITYKELLRRISNYYIDET